MSLKILDNFNLRTSKPLDKRSSVGDFLEIDTPYQGLLTFNLKYKKFYKYVDNEYVDFNKDINEEITKIKEDINTLNLKNEFNIINVKEIGCTGLGDKDDTKTVQDKLNLTNGNTILYFPCGTYKFNNLIIPPKTIVTGQGNSSKLLPFSQTDSVLTLNGDFIEISNLSIENINNLALNGISCTKEIENLPMVIKSLYIASFKNGIKWLKSTRCQIDSCSFVNNETAINVFEDFRNSVITRNFILGGNGIRLSRTIIQAEGVIISENQILSGNMGVPTYAILIDGGLAIKIINNIIDQVFKGVAIQVNNNITKDIHISNNWIGANYDSIEAQYGILAYGCEDLYIKENTIVGFSQSGIYCLGNINSPLKRVYIENNNAFIGDISNIDIRLDYTQDLTIRGCTFNGTGNIIEGEGCNGIVENCIFNYVPARVNLKYYKQVKGIVESNSGNATLVANTQSITINHGLSYPPKVEDITIKALNFPSENIGLIVIDTITASNFRLTAQFTPTTNVNFNWKASI